MFRTGRNPERLPDPNVISLRTPRFSPLVHKNYKLISPYIYLYVNEVMSTCTHLF